MRRRCNDNYSMLNWHGKSGGMERSSKPTTPDERARRTSAGSSDGPSHDDDDARQVWELTLRTVTALLRAFEDDMKAEGFALPWYDVLIQLVNAPQQRLRMQDLADAVVVTRSGLSRLIDRMEKAGLVRREPVADDGRGSYAALTEQGRAAYDRLAADHHRKIDERFGSRLSGADLRALRRAMRKLGMVVR
jgi:DNA-binding MarR family transcriptional regulator